jgi:hypothetical protein
MKTETTFVKRCYAAFTHKQDMPGKFYGNFSSEAVQNWLTYEPDPVIPAFNAGPWVLSAWAAQPCMLLLGVLCLTVTWATLATCRMKFGTLGYLITLQSLKDRASNTLLQAVYVIFTITLIIYGFFSFNEVDSGSELYGSPYKLVQTAMAIVSITAGLYSVMVDSSPVNLRMLTYMVSKAS